MDKYFLTIIALIIFSIIVVFYVKISRKTQELKSDETKSLLNNDSTNYDEIKNKPTELGFETGDFTILE